MIFFFRFSLWWCEWPPRPLHQSRWHLSSGHPDGPAPSPTPPRRRHLKSAHERPPGGTAANTNAVLRWRQSRRVWILDAKLEKSENHQGNHCLRRRPRIVFQWPISTGTIVMFVNGNGEAFFDGSFLRTWKDRMFRQWCLWSSKMRGVDLFSVQCNQQLLIDWADVAIFTCGKGREAFLTPNIF